nr:Chain A, Piscidin [Oplegnathus fasciatus]
FLGMLLHGVGHAIHGLIHGKQNVE